jgi:hypothetical protein
MHTGTSAGVRRSISPNSASAVWSGDIRNGSLSEGRPADGRQSHCFELRPDETYSVDDENKTHRGR